MNNIFDLVVIGGGHAGVEAVLAGKRMGHNVALITLDKTKTGRMSCNPAIGGIGKTHLAKEIDALGGYMAEATDLSGIQFRTLNKKKGPAVQATRAQADKELYEKTIQAKLKKEQIDVFEDEVIDFEEKNGLSLSRRMHIEQRLVVLRRIWCKQETILRHSRRPHQCAVRRHCEYITLAVTHNCRGKCS